jgi:hypothetical protein
MGHRGASSRPGVIVGPRPSDRGSARRCRAWRRRRCTSQHPTSPSTSLTSYVGQEIIVANNTVCSSCLTSWSPSRPGSRDVPVMWLALSEFHYCRHNSCSVELCLPYPAQIQGNPAVFGRWFFIVMWNCKEMLNQILRQAQHCNAARTTRPSTIPNLCRAYLCLTCGASTTAQHRFLVIYPSSYFHVCAYKLCNIHHSYVHLSSHATKFLPHTVYIYRQHGLLRHVFEIQNIVSHLKSQPPDLEPA